MRNASSKRARSTWAAKGVSQAVNFPEVRNEIVALKKLEQEQKEVALRISTIEEGIRKIELQRENNAKEQNAALAKLEEQKKPIASDCRKPNRPRSFAIGSWRALSGGSRKMTRRTASC